MIAKRLAYCSELEIDVEALIEEKRLGRGRNAPTQSTPVSCTRMAECPRTSFCRFVNPLTTRNPLEPDTEVDRSAAAG